MTMRPDAITVEVHHPLYALSRPTTRDPSKAYRQALDALALRCRLLNSARNEQDPSGLNRIPVFLVTHQRKRRQRPDFAGLAVAGPSY